MRAPSEVVILLPARDAEGTIEASLESLRSQTFPDFRCVIVDDGSRDRTAAVVEDRIRDDPRFALVRQPPRGIASALIRAAAGSREPLIARQDADDVSYPDRLRTQVERLRSRPEIGLVATEIETVSEAPPTDGWRRYERWLRSCVTPREIANNLWIESPLPHPTVVMRRGAYEAAGGYRESGWPEDYDLLLRMRRREVRMVKIPRVLYRWSDRPGRASRNRPEYGAERFLECRAHHLTRYLGPREAVIWGAGRDGRRAARALLAEGAKVNAFLDIDPRKIGRVAQGRPIRSALAWVEERRAELSERAGEIPEPVVRSEVRAIGLRDRGVASPDRTSAPDPDELPALTELHPILIVAVGASGARDLIKARLDEIGYLEGRDFLCIA